MPFSLSFLRRCVLSVAGCELDLTSAAVAELADARDLKSLGGQLPYRFNSGQRHHSITARRKYMIKKGPASKILQISILLTVFGFLTLLNGCGGVHRPFELVDKNTRIKPGSLAVLSGSSSEVDVKLAANLTQELKKRSTFHVMSQEEIARRVPGYPSEIFRNSKVPKEEEDNYAWISQGNKARVDAAHAQLNTDYVFVIWAGQLNKWVTSGQGGTRVDYAVSVYGRFFEYSKGKIVAYSAFGRSKGQSCCLFGKSEGEDIDALLKDSAEEAADKFISVTGSEKASK